MCADDRAPLVSLLRRIDVFNPEEVEVAIELIDEAIEDRPENDYEAVVAVDLTQPEEAPLGYACFGPTPMTDRTYDLYWVAVDPAQQGKGLGAGLVRAVEALIAARGGLTLRVETSSKEAYGKTLAFYRRIDYVEGGCIPDFYSAGDDLLILYRRVASS